MKHLTYYLTLIIATLFIQIGYSQVQLTLTIPNLGSPYLNDYIGDESNRILIITNTTNQQQSIFLRGKIEQINGRGFFIKTKEGYNPSTPIVLDPLETKTLFARSEDWAFMESAQLENNIPQAIERRIQATGIIPEGDYKICVQAFDFNTGAQLSPAEPAGCLFFQVTLGTPPQLIQPVCNDTVNQEYPLIVWSPAILMRSRVNIVYDLYVVELISPVLNPQEVMEQSILYRGGNPFVVEDLHQTTYQFRPGDPPLNPDSRYAVCVVARTEQGTAQFENKGRSEICVFNTPSTDEGNGGYGSGVTYTTYEPEDFQMFLTSHLQGKLLYRFYGDYGTTGESIMKHSTGEINLMNLQNGQSIQNQGYQTGGNGKSMKVMSDGSLPTELSHAFNQAPPPQYILPEGYTTAGGRPLKQAKITFTTRYAIGKKLNIQHPDDLEFIPETVYTIIVNGSQLTEEIVIQDPVKVIAATTTDNNGNYNVSFFADESYGMITSAPIQVHWGPNEFEENINGYGLYRVITMQVEEKRYCHPDIVIFLQPGQSLDVPTQCVTVKSYNVRFTVMGNDHPGAASSAPIPSAIVKIGRKKALYNYFPTCFPENELKREEYSNQTIAYNVMTADTGMTDANGQITFTHLVKHEYYEQCGGEGYNSSHYGTIDPYYVKVGSHPTQGFLTYAWKTIEQFAPCHAVFEVNCGKVNCGIRSAQYVPPTINYTVVLLPTFPDIVAHSVGIFNGFKQPLPHVNMVMFAFHKNDLGLTSYQTDANGNFIKQFTTNDIPELMRVNEADGLITTTYAMVFHKSGYEFKSCNDCGTTTPKTLQYGERWKLLSQLTPDSHVKGIVEDEHGQALSGRIKIGDGPFLKFGPKPTLFTETNNNDDSPYVMDMHNKGIPNMQPKEEEQGMQFHQSGGSQSDLEHIVMKKGGTNIEYEFHKYLKDNWEMVSRFEYPAASGQHIPVIILPDASNYFPDTFYIDIPTSYEGDFYDIGTFVIKEKLHRPQVEVYFKIAVYNPNQQGPSYHLAPVDSAEVILSTLPHKLTDSEGNASWVFGSPSHEFHLRVNEELYVPYDEFVTIPVTKEPYKVQVILKAGNTLFGTVTRADNNQPIEHARIHAEIGQNTYGPIVIETFTDENGNYVLKGLPSYCTVQATKADSGVTYIGQNKTFNSSLNNLNFQLVEAPFNLSHIWNLPVALESVTPIGIKWKIDGAFVNLPTNNRFHPEVKTQRLAFTDIVVTATGPPGLNGKPIASPVGNSIMTDVMKFRSILNNAFIVEMTGPISSGGMSYIYNPNFSPVSINKIRVDKEANNNGEVKTRTFSLLEYFRFTYQYDGQFYLGETPDNLTMTCYKGTADNTMPETYFLIGYNNGLNQIENPSFSIHNFPAYIDRNESYVHQDSFVFDPELIVDLPLSNPDKIYLDMGSIIVLPDKVYVNSGDEPLEFDLETWHVETGAWDFDPYKGGFISSGTIQTNLLEFNAPHILIQPTNLLLAPAEDINLNSLTLGGVVDLDIASGAKLLFDYQAHPIHDPAHGHWRVELANQNPGQAVASINGLPGWPAQSEVDIEFIDNYSDGFKKLTMASNQVIDHYNMIEQTITGIYLYENGVAFVGNTDLDIPNLTSGASAAFVYSKNGNQIDLRVQGLYTTFESNGQVTFFGDQQPERIMLTWDHFEITGDLRIFNSNYTDSIPLRGKLIKIPGDIRLKIIKVDGSGELEGNINQIIVLGSGAQGYQKVLQGEQLVTSGAWEDLIYQVQYMEYEGSFQDGQDMMWFRVTGDITNDKSKNDEIQLTNIETPFGDFNLSFDLVEMAIVGGLNITTPITMGAVQIIAGAMELRMGSPGFYIAAGLQGIYPVIGTLKTNLIVGSYPQVSPEAQQILKTGMYIQKLPTFLINDGIHGLYICANKPFFETEITIPLPIPILFWAEAGIDARFWLNFSSNYGAAHLGALAYAGVELYSTVLVCEMCIGLTAELSFKVEYVWNPPPASFTIEGCGSIAIHGALCEATFSESAKLIIGWSSNPSDFNVEAIFGENCSGNSLQTENGCVHF